MKKSFRASGSGTLLWTHRHPPRTCDTVGEAWGFPLVLGRSIYFSLIFIFIDHSKPLHTVLNVNEVAARKLMLHLLPYLIRHAACY